MRSILFTAPNEEKNPSFVCEDLKLDLIFEPEVLNIILCRPSAENITLRREMFAEVIEHPELYQELTELEAMLSKAFGLYGSFENAVCEAQRAYVFPFLFDAVSEFAHKGASLSAKCKALSELQAELSSVCSNERFAEAEKRLPELKSSVSGCFEFFIKTDNGRSRIYKENEIDITASLLECARELNIELRTPSPKRITLQKGLVEGIQGLSAEVFARATEFLNEHQELASGEMFGYLDELRFVLAIVDFTRNASSHGIPYSFPEISSKREVQLSSAYDITLLKKEGTKIVPNDISFTPCEPFFYLTGANGGGKTTYIRAVGCAVLMFLAGAPVFCEGGECPVFDSVLTHFPRDERFEGSGRFFDEIRRVDELLAVQSGNSLILLNETYATTGEDKAREYTDALARRLYQSGSFGLYITHQHDVREEQIPFLGVVVDESDSNRRTYRIEKRRLPPKSFARDILEKYGLTRDLLRLKFKERQSNS